MITNITIKNDVDLYYELNANNNKSNKSNKSNKCDTNNKLNKKQKIEIDYDDDISSSMDFCDYEKLIDDIYNNEIENKSLSPEYTNECSNNYNIEYCDYITNNNNNNSKIYSHKKNNNKNKKKLTCDECNNENIIEDTSHGILVCTNCGHVVSSLIDCGAEWTQYNDDNKKDMNRCSHPISQLLPQSSMATTIAGSCSSRIKTLHGWSAMPYKERSLNEVFKIIQSKCAKGRIMK